MTPEIANIVVSAAQRYGLDPDGSLKIADIESKGDPNARNPSGASGLFQFMPKTAAQYGLDDPTDPVASADAAMRLMQDNARSLSKTLGRDPTMGELYLAHQQGAGGAAKLLANPDARAGDLVGDAAVKQNGGDPNAPASAFASMWTSRLGGGVAKVAPASATSRGGGASAPFGMGATPAPAMAGGGARDDGSIEAQVAAIFGSGHKADDDQDAMLRPRAIEPRSPPKYDAARFAGLLSRRKT